MIFERTMLCRSSYNSYSIYIRLVANIRIPNLPQVQQAGVLQESCHTLWDACVYAGPLGQYSMQALSRLLKKYILFGLNGNRRPEAKKQKHMPLNSLAVGAGGQGNRSARLHGHGSWRCSIFCVVGFTSLMPMLRRLHAFAAHMLPEVKFIYQSSHNAMNLRMSAY